MKKTDYEFKCVNKDDFTLVFHLNTESKFFDLFWKKAIKKLRKKKIEIEESFANKIGSVSIKEVPIPNNLKILFEGRMRRKVNILLKKIAKRANLVFFTWWLDDAVYTKGNKDWEIKIVFNGSYARK